jgi:hypothetical protein
MSNGNNGNGNGNSSLTLADRMSMARANQERRLPVLSSQPVYVTGISQADYGTPQDESEIGGALSRTPLTPIPKPRSGINNLRGIYALSAESCDVNYRLPPCPPEEVQRQICSVPAAVSRYYATDGVIKIVGSPDFGQNLVDVGILRELAMQLRTRAGKAPDSVLVPWASTHHTLSYAPSAEENNPIIGVKVLMSTSVFEEALTRIQVQMGDTDNDAGWVANLPDAAVKPALDRSGAFVMQKRTCALYLPFGWTPDGQPPRVVQAKWAIDVDNAPVPVTLTIDGLTSDWTVEVSFLGLGQVETNEFLAAVEGAE